MQASAQKGPQVRKLGPGQPMGHQAQIQPPGGQGQKAVPEV